MRWFIGILILVNLIILAWGWLGDDEQPGSELAAPGVGTIRLLGEPPATPEPVAVPIPAPPRDSGQMATREAAEPAPAATVTPAAPAQPPKAQPLTQTEAPAVAAAPAQSEPEAEPPQPVVSAPEPEYVPEPDAIAPVLPRACARIGPFADAAAAKATRGYLAGLGQVSDHRQTGQQRVGWWVLVPPQPSRAAAEAIAATLKAKGIKDYWVVSKGEAKNGISLGVFSQKGNAQALVKRLRAKDLDVQMREKTKPVRQLWLDYSGTKPVTAAEIGSRAPAGVQVKSRGCPATGVRG